MFTIKALVSSLKEGVGRASGGTNITKSEGCKSIHPFTILRKFVEHSPKNTSIFVGIIYR